MDLKHAQRKYILDNLPRSEPKTLPWDHDFEKDEYERDGAYALAWWRYYLWRWNCKNVFLIHDKNILNMNYLKSR